MGNHKTIITTLAAFLIALPVCQVHALDYAPGSAVEVEYGGAWYPATILKASPGKWLIHYDAYDSSWDEWVEADRIHPVDTDERFAASPRPPADTLSPTASGSATRKPAVVEPPDVTVYYDPYEIGIELADGSKIRLRSDGIIERDGKEIGRMDATKSGVSARGKELGHIDARYNIVAGGKIVGSLSPEDYSIQRDGKTIARFEDDALLLGEVIKGTSSMYDGSYADPETVALYFIFFDPDFGFVR